MILEELRFSPYGRIGNQHDFVESAIMDSRKKNQALL